MIMPGDRRPATGELRLGGRLAAKALIRSEA
jgi:hypothetical protein